MVIWRWSGEGCEATWSVLNKSDSDDGRLHGVYVGSTGLSPTLKIRAAGQCDSLL